MAEATAVESGQVQNRAGESADDANYQMRAVRCGEGCIDRRQPTFHGASSEAGCGQASAGLQFGADPLGRTDHLAAGSKEHWRADLIEVMPAGTPQHQDLGLRAGGLQGLHDDHVAIGLGPQTDVEQSRPDLGRVHPGELGALQVDRAWLTGHVLHDDPKPAGVVLVHVAKPCGDAERGCHRHPHHLVTVAGPVPPSTADQLVDHGPPGRGDGVLEPERVHARQGVLTGDLGQPGLLVGSPLSGLALTLRRHERLGGHHAFPYRIGPSRSRTFSQSVLSPGRPGDAISTAYLSRCCSPKARAARSPRLEPGRPSSFAASSRSAAMMTWRVAGHGSNASMPAAWTAAATTMLGLDLGTEGECHGRGGLDPLAEDQARRQVWVAP